MTEDTQPDRYQHIQVRYSKLAIASLILGILSWIPGYGMFFGLPAITLGISALIIIKNLKLLGKRQAIAGIVLVISSFIFYLSLLFGTLFLFKSNNPGIFEGMNKSLISMNLKNCAGRLELYKKDNGHYPDSLKNVAPPGELGCFQDGNEKDFYYQVSKDTQNYELRSLGTDGIYGTADDITLNDNIQGFLPK